MENKSLYKRLFPLLTDYDVYFNSESYKYNCISHTINIDNRNSWPTNPKFYWPVKRELTKESFDLFYEYHGFVKCSLDFSHDVKYIKVALFCNNIGTPTHASIQVANDWWGSKIGSLGIIKHDLFEIEDLIYGEVTQIYKKLKRLDERILSFGEFIENCVLS